MKQEISATNFPEVYKNLGIDPGKLGCIMIDTEKIVVSDTIAEDDLYYSDPAVHKWIQGVVSEDVPHVTLLYGLLRSGKELQRHVNAVLKDWDAGNLTIDQVGFFYSNDPAEKYVTLVALIKVTDNLNQGNARLRLLPHIDTFPEYKPHITLAYLKESADYTSYINTLNTKLAGRSIKSVGINLGD